VCNDAEKFNGDSHGNSCSVCEHFLIKILHVLEKKDSCYCNEKPNTDKYRKFNYETGKINEVEGFVELKINFLLGYLVN